jgi:hypothetical protein
LVADEQQNLLVKQQNLLQASNEICCPEQQNLLVSATKSVAPTGPDAAAGAGPGNAKKNSKDNSKKKNHDGGEHGGFAFTADQLESLSKVTEGLTIKPDSLPKRLRARLEELIKSKGAPLSLLDDFDGLGLVGKLAWYCRAMEIARANNPEPASWVALAAGNILRALKAGTDLLDEHPKVASIAEAREAKVAKTAFEAWREGVGRRSPDGSMTACIAEAQRFAQTDGVTLDPREAMERFEQSGWEASLRWMWDAAQAAIEARRLNESA